MKLQRVRQRLPSLPIADLPTAVRAQMEQMVPDKAALVGKRIGVTAGSRGIHRINEVVILVVAWLKEIGARPFVIPAMGSHGGATSAGQEAILRHYGITPETVGAPILSDMDTVRIGGADGLNAYWARVAFEADGVILLNRVKLHTGFIGVKVESGLAKIGAVGLGKEAGATEIHSQESRLGMERGIRIVFDAALALGKIIGGLAIVEDGHHQLSSVTGFRPGDIIEGEARLLKRSAELMARLPFLDVDLLHVREMGKDVSGSGMDPNIVGKSRTGFRLRELPRPRMTTIGRVVVSDLTPASEGNATGVAFADAISRRLGDKIDAEKTRINCAASHALELAVAPPAMASDRELLDISLGEMGLAADSAKVACIQNTLNLGCIYVSPALARALDSSIDCEVGEPFEPDFDVEGYLQLTF